MSNSSTPTTAEVHPFPNAKAPSAEAPTAPGLPSKPSSEKIFLNDQGQIEGLF